MKKHFVYNGPSSPVYQRVLKNTNPDGFATKPDWPLLVFMVLARFSLGLMTVGGGFSIAGLELPGWLPGIALTALVIGLGVSVFHLGSPRHIVKMVRNPNSRLAKEVLLVSSGIFVVSLNLIMSETYPITSGFLDAAQFGIGFTGLIYLGRVFMYSARPAWNTPVLSFQYIISGLWIGLLFGNINQAYPLSPIGLRYTLALLIAVQMVLVGYYYVLQKKRFSGKGQIILSMLGRRFVLTYFLFNFICPVFFLMSLKLTIIVAAVLVCCWFTGMVTERLLFFRLGEPAFLSGRC